MTKTKAFLRSAVWFLFAAMGSSQTLQRVRPSQPVQTNSAPQPSTRFPASWYPPTRESVYTETITRGLPYSAIMVTTSSFTDPQSGKVTAVEKKTRQLRDKFGRRRDETETARPDAQGKAVTVHEVTVHDPVAHCDFQWMEPWVVTLPQFSQPTSLVTCRPLTERFTLQNIWRDGIVKAESRQHDPLRETLSEPLGSREMEGLMAEGTRTTRVLLDQSGRQTGSVTTEIWYSPDLDEMLSMTQNNTPAERAIIQSFRLTNIKQRDPDPALFYPPKEYRIKSTNVVER